MTMTRRGALAQLATLPAAVPAVLAMPASGQEKFPSRPITIIVPYPPGGGGDLLARVLQPALSKELDVPVVVDNRRGAGGVVGVNAALARPADGYTLLSWSRPSNNLSGMVGAATFRASDFTAVGACLVVQTIVAVPANRPWKTLAELVADMKKRPGTISMGGIGPYASGGIGYAAFKDKVNVKGIWIPYQGTAEVMAALVSGQVDAVMGASNEQDFIEHVKSGRVRILGSLARTVAKPYQPLNVPTAEQAIGIPFDNDGQLGHVVRAGTPPERVAILREAYRKVAAMPDIVEQLEKQVGPFHFIPGPDFDRRIHDESDLASLVPTLRNLDTK